MRSNRSDIKDAAIDVLIIGGGVTGAFLAWELSRRKVRVALLEKDDFGGFTSASSSKLLHGGIRYLQALQFRKVYESSKERARFINFSPNIPNYVPFLIPTFKKGLSKSRWFMRAGMALYDFITWLPNRRIFDKSKRVPGTYFLRSDEIDSQIPSLAGLQDLSGGQVFHEAHMHSSERMTFSLVRAAIGQGALVANYTEVEHFLVSKNVVSGVRCRDRLRDEAFDMSCNLVVNAAGPHTPMLNRLLGASLDVETSGYSKGMHLVTRQIDPKYALALVTRMKSEAKISRGGRHIFIIPWRNRSLIGTTNVPFQSDSLNNVEISEQEIQDFLEEINSALPEATLTRQDVYYAYAGLYPLISEEVKSDTYQGTGEYQIVDHAKTDDIDGLVTVMGAKFTTAGRVAERAMQTIMPKIQSGRFSVLDERHEDWSLESFYQFKKRVLNDYSSVLSKECLDHLITHYGRAAEKIVKRVELDPEMSKALAPGHYNILAELYHALDEEMIFHLDDFIFRRTGLGTIGHPGDACIETCARIMAQHFGWSEQEITEQMLRVSRYYQYG